MLAVDRPRAAKKEMKAFTPEQVKAFLDAIEDAGHGSMFAFLFEIGCRPTEFHALKWADINWQAGKVTIQRNLVRIKSGGGKWTFSEPKTEKGRRTIPLSKSLIEQLLKHRRAQNEQRLLVVSERLGHANINITLEVYSHIFPGMQDEATERLEKLIFG